MTHTPPTTIAVGGDHRGTPAIKHISEHLTSKGHTVTIHTCDPGSTCDYPDNAYNVANAVAKGEADRGILVCGSGIGVSIAANKVPGVRAALVHDELSAEMSRAHNNANVLCLPGDLMGQRLMEKVIDRWLKTEFEGGRHARRVRKITAIEEGHPPTSITE